VEKESIHDSRRISVEREIEVGIGTRSKMEKIWCERIEGIFIDLQIETVIPFISPVIRRIWKI
jgi:hypothetical protein